MYPGLLKDQVAIITGGNSGIGKAIAITYARAGARIALFGTNAQKGQMALQEIAEVTQGQAKAFFYTVDVSQKQAVEEAISAATKDLGEISILVNNAGITRDALLMKISEEDWDRVIAINLKSVYNTCHALIRSLLKARRGKIINITSVVGLIGNPGQCNYAAAKAGMIGFTKSLAREAASRNICVNCIAPGFIETAMTNDLSEDQKQNAVKSIPMGRFGRPEDIADLATFLASDSANYITGQVFTVDGGMAM